MLLWNKSVQWFVFSKLKCQAMLHTGTVFHICAANFPEAFAIPFYHSQLKRHKHVNPFIQKYSIGSVPFFHLPAPYRSQSWLVFELHILQYEVWESPQQQLWPFHPFLQSPQQAGKWRRLRKWVVAKSTTWAFFCTTIQVFIVSLYTVLANHVSYLHMSLPTGSWYKLRDISNKRVFLLLKLHESKTMHGSLWNQRVKRLYETLALHWLLPANQPLWSHRYKYPQRPFLETPIVKVFPQNTKGDASWPLKQLHRHHWWGTPWGKILPRDLLL